MKDLFKSYHRSKMLSHIGVFSLACILAVSINMFVLSGNNAAFLKASIIESTQPAINQDIQIIRNGSLVQFIATQPLQNVEEISLSFAYNPDRFFLGDIVGNDTIDISTIDNEPGFVQYILRYTPPTTLAQGSNIISIPGEKTQEDSTIHINPINLNFTDSSGETYFLQAESIYF